MSKGFFILFFMFVLSSFSFAAYGNSFLFLDRPSDAALLGLGNSDLSMNNAVSIYNNYSSVAWSDELSHYRVNSYSDSFDFYKFNGVASFRHPFGTTGICFSTLFSKDDNYEGTSYNTLYQAWNCSAVYSTPVIQLLGQPFSLHGGVDVISETVADETIYGLGFQAGITTAFFDKRLFAAASVDRLGMAFGKADVPPVISAGLKYRFIDWFSDKSGWFNNLQASISYRLEDINLQYLLSGVEADFFHLFSLRAGLTLPMDRTDLAYGMTLNFGLGIIYNGFSLDMAYAPQYAAQQQFLVTIGYRFQSESSNTNNKSLTIKEIIQHAKKLVMEDNKAGAIEYLEEQSKILPGNPEIQEMLLLLRSSHIKILHQGGTK